MQQIYVPGVVCSCGGPYSLIPPISTGKNGVEQHFFLPVSGGCKTGLAPRLRGIGPHGKNNNPWPRIGFCLRSGRGGTESAAGLSLCLGGVRRKKHIKTKNTLSRRRRRDEVEQEEEKR